MACVAQPRYLHKTCHKKYMETTDNKSNSLIEQMFEVGAHYGYARSRRHPSFASFVFGTKNGNDVLNLEKTGAQLHKVLEYIKASASEGKTFLFVGTKPEIRNIVEEAALSVDSPVVINRWIGGLLTNFSEMKKRFKKLEDLRAKKEKGELSVYTKKEQILINAEIDDLARNFGGVVSMTQLPDIMFVVDPRHEAIAVTEARKKNIPVIALAGSDCNLGEVTHTIPANDATIQSVSFFVAKVVEAIKEGQAHPKKAEEKKSEKADEKKA